MPDMAELGGRDARPALSGNGLYRPLCSGYTWEPPLVNSEKGAAAALRSGT